MGAITAESEIDADSWAWGFNVGVMWSPVENLRFGASYRSKVKHDAEGDLRIKDPRLMTAESGKWGSSLPPEAVAGNPMLAAVLGSHEATRPLRLPPGYGLCRLGRQRSPESLCFLPLDGLVFV